MWRQTVLSILLREFWAPLQLILYYSSSTVNNSARFLTCSDVRERYKLSPTPTARQWAAGISQC